MSLSRDQILNVNDAQITEVDVPEWNGKVHLRVMSGRELEQLTESFADTNGSTEAERVRGLRARLASLTICDDKGVRLFTDEDVEALGKKNSLALDRIFTAAQKLNGIEEKAVEEELGN